jgi:DNA polymerase-3 subunit delta
MTPENFLSSIARQAPAPAYLFLGPEAYRRGLCRKALIERVLAPEEIDAGLARHDLDEVTVAEVVDDARAISLFAPKRVIWVSSAESALPKGKAVSDDDEGSKDSPAALLAAYLKNPAPGVVLVFECARFDFEGDDKARIERVRKFYSAVQAVVEFARLEPAEARRLAADLARAAGLKIGHEELELLLHALGGDAARIAVEIDKLALYIKDGRPVTESDIAALVPDARDTTIFALVNALGRSDRTRSLEILDTLVREGEYLPLALSFLGTQFRFALAAKESNLRSTQQVQSFFQSRGTPMWRSRAEQVYQTSTTFSTQKLQNAIRRIYSADRDLRDARPDDRIVIEEFILALTAPA